VGGEFYKAIAPVAWPRLTAGLENDPALRLKEAVDRWNARDADGARQIVEAYLNVRPADYEAWQLYAVLCAESGRSDELLQTTSQLLQLRPREPFGYVWHGLALLLSDQAEGGLVQGSLASTIDGHLLWAKLVRGLSLIPMGRADEAVGEFDEVLRASPELVVALLGRASARSAAGRFAEALPDANEVLRIEPDNADALTIRGDCFTALADYGAAARDFQRAMALAGRTPALGIRYLSALVHERNLAEAKAREEASRPSGVDPSVDPDEEGSRGPLLDWFSRKIWPRAGPAGPADGGS
jgi:tetratricopeptide (TPR) repeat protein